MKKKLQFLCLAFLLSLAGCAPKFNPSGPDEGGKDHLQPTGRSVTTYLALMVTDNRTSYRTMALCADRARTADGSLLTADCPDYSVKAIERAASLKQTFVRLAARTTLDKRAVCCRHDNIKDCCDTGGKDVFVSANRLEDIQSYDVTLDGKSFPGTPLTTLDDALGACRGRIFACLDMTAGLNFFYTSKIIDSLAIADEILYYLGDLGAEGTDHSESQGWKNYMEMGQYVAKLAPVFKASGTEAVDFIESQDLSSVVTFEVPDASLAAYCHQSGFAVYSDISASDADLASGNTAAVETEAARRTDIVCCGVGDSAPVVQFLKNHNLNL
ncbi:MAG: hypothetical protein IJS66_02450 [Bacteroidales bacterium]|nr:hypothetical protein [Bacteroidales bacterium]